LTFDTRILIFTLDYTCLINATNRIGMCILSGDQTLAFIAKKSFIKNNRLPKTLQGSRCNVLDARDRLSIFPLDIR